MNQPNPFAAAGLGNAFAPSPIAWAFGKVEGSGPNGAMTLHLLTFDTVIGKVAFAFDPDSLRRLADQIVEQVSGIQVATAIPANGNRAMRRHPLT